MPWSLYPVSVVAVFSTYIPYTVDLACFYTTEDKYLGLIES